MHEFLTLTLSAIAGIALGIFYFYSLWITVRQLPSTQWPFRLVVGSAIGRTVITLFGFYIVMDGDWKRAIAVLIGFIIGRTILVTWKGKIGKPHLN